MIIYRTGNLFEAKTQALVNTVNTVGVMGKGIALQFKNAFPDNTKAYEKAVKAGDVKLGEMLVVRVSSSLEGTQYVINFPTKAHWRNPSQLSWVKSGLQHLRKKILEYGITSIALPPLGCGNGGLNWEDVKPEIEKALNDLSAEIVVYEPSLEIKIILEKQDKQAASKLTPARAMMLQLLYRYRVMGEFASEFAAEKLSYFLQRFGEKQLKLTFQKGVYGPYSGKVKHVLYEMNGYYLKGYEQKDSRPFEPLQLIVEKAPEVRDYIENALPSQDRERLQKVSDFMDGYESPYGLELLASVDFLMQENGSFDLETVKQGLTTWSNRKAAMFSDIHLQLAITHLSKYPSLYGA